MPGRTRGSSRAMPGSAVRYQDSVDGDEVGQCTPEPGLDDPGPVAAGQQVLVDTEGREFVGRQVDAPAIEILAHIAQEIRELERLAQRRGRRLGLGDRDDRAQYRQQLQSDRCRRTAHVLAQLGHLGYRSRNSALPGTSIRMASRKTQKCSGAMRYRSMVSIKAISTGVVAGRLRLARAGRGREPGQCRIAIAVR